MQGSTSAITPGMTSCVSEWSINSQIYVAESYAVIGIATHVLKTHAAA
jgi:hypothetical protein